MRSCWFVYILTCADGTYYTGITTDPVRRLKEHNGPKSTTKYTRVRQPVVMAYRESCGSRSEAAQREYSIKALTRAEKAQLCAHL